MRKTSYSAGVILPEGWNLIQVNKKKKQVERREIKMETYQVALVTRGIRSFSGMAFSSTGITESSPASSYHSVHEKRSCM